MKNTKLVLLLSTGIICTTLMAQDLSYSKSGHTFYPELANPVETDTKEWAGITKAVNVSFASDNVRYPKEKVPQVTLQDLWEAKAWKGERIHTQILVWTNQDIAELSFQLQDLSSKKGTSHPGREHEGCFCPLYHG